MTGAQFNGLAMLVALALVGVGLELDPPHWGLVVVGVFIWIDMRLPRGRK